MRKLSVSAGVFEIEEKYQQAFEAYKVTAEAGNSWDQLTLWDFYTKGIGTEKDIKKAAFWLMKAASGGRDIAQLMVASYYSGGACGFEKDSLTALKWFRLGIQKNPSREDLINGVTYYNGDVIPIDRKNKEKGALLIYKLATTDNSREQMDVAGGNSLRKLADGNDKFAQFYYSACLDQYDFKEEALEYLKKSADQGYPKAQYNLGFHYKEEKKMEEAKRWFKAASGQGHERAIEALNRLK